MTYATISYGLWQINDYNLFIDSCNLKNFQLIFGHRSPNNLKSPDINFTMMNSFFTALTDEAFQPFIRVTKGNAHFKNVTVNEIFSEKGGSIIKVEDSFLYFLGCILSNNNVEVSFLNVSHKSLIIMEECAIVNNNSTQFSFIVITDSTSRFTNCNFTYNMGNTGGAIFGAQNNVISIESCHFTNNSATTGGGSIATYNNTLLNITTRKPVGFMQSCCHWRMTYDIPTSSAHHADNIHISSTCYEDNILMSSACHLHIQNLPELPNFMT